MKISELAFNLFFENQGEFSESQKEFMMQLIAMQEGEEFEIPHETLKLLLKENSELC